MPDLPRFTPLPSHPPPEPVMSETPVIAQDSNTNWANNSIQFPRLIAELEAAGAFTGGLVDLVAESMDLDPSQVYELVDRAQCVWDEIKQRTHNPTT